MSGKTLYLLSHYQEHHRVYQKRFHSKSRCGFQDKTVILHGSALPVDWVEQNPLNLGKGVCYLTWFDHTQSKHQNYGGEQTNITHTHNIQGRIQRFGKEGAHCRIQR